MSTKSTIEHGTLKSRKGNIDFHLYSDLFDDVGEECVWLEMWSSNRDVRSATVAIPIAIWEVIRRGRHPVMSVLGAGKTDEELAANVAKQVKSIDALNAKMKRERQKDLDILLKKK